MTFQEALDETVAILRRYGRVSYRGLKRQLGVDDEFLEDLRIELTDVLNLAADEDGKVLVWLGTGAERASVVTAVDAPKACHAGAARRGLRPRYRAPQSSAHSCSRRPV